MQSAKCKMKVSAELMIGKRRIDTLQAGSIGAESVLCKPGMFFAFGFLVFWRFSFGVFSLGALVWAPGFGVFALGLRDWLAVWRFCFGVGLEFWCGGKQMQNAKCKMQN